MADRRVTFGRAALPLLIVLMSFSAAAQERPELPLVISAAVPTYPHEAVLAGIEGSVTIRLTTDGFRAVRLEVKNGQPMLARFAQESLRTWRFEKHRPTAFEVTFRYRLLPVGDCAFQNPTVMLKLPTEVEISSATVHTFDETEEIRK